MHLQVNIDQFNQAADRSYQLAMSVGVQVCDLMDDALLEHFLAQTDKLMYEHKRMKRLSLTPRVREDDRRIYTTLLERLINDSAQLKTRTRDLRR